MTTNTPGAGQAAKGVAASLGAKLAAQARQPLRARHVPQRTCIACRSTSAKREFVRLVRSQDGHVEVDPTGKKAGRGAYLCSRASCWELALKKERLSAALKIKVSAEDAGQLRTYATTLPAG
jgi:predicted RNA-binding protein YlxR (DUF448 family)